jgi:hypothetical protein
MRMRRCPQGPVRAPHILETRRQFRKSGA